MISTNEDVGITVFYLKCKGDCMSFIVNDFSSGVSSHQDVMTMIAGIWDTVLHIESVGQQDDFFDIGGNSLLLIAMLEEVENRFKKSINMEELADGVTVEKIASLVV